MRGSSKFSDEHGFHKGLGGFGLSILVTYGLWPRKMLRPNFQYCCEQCEQKTDTYLFRYSHQVGIIKQPRTSFRNSDLGVRR